MHELLDKYLCQKYPKIFAERDKSPMESCMHWGLAVGNGWFSLIDDLCSRIQSHIDSNNESVDKGYTTFTKGKIPQVVALQVKEKFSGLRFYYSGGDDYVRGIVDFAEDLSYSICDVCGVMNEKVGRNPQGWHVTTCKDHANNVENFQTNGDDELNNIWKKVHEDEEKERKKIEAARSSKV
jgi:hypothetical protein